MKNFVGIEPTAPNSSRDYRIKLDAGISVGNAKKQSGSQNIGLPLFYAKTAAEFLTPLS